MPETSADLLRRAATKIRDGEVIALWHPGVTTLVADWLDASADPVTEDQWLDTEALTLARAILGED